LTQDIPAPSLDSGTVGSPRWGPTVVRGLRLDLRGRMARPDDDGGRSRAILTRRPGRALSERPHRGGQPAGQTFEACRRTSGSWATARGQDRGSRCRAAAALARRLPLIAERGGARAEIGERGGGCSEERQDRCRSPPPPTGSPGVGRSRAARNAGRAPEPAGGRRRRGGDGGSAGGRLSPGARQGRASYRRATGRLAKLSLVANRILLAGLGRARQGTTPYLVASPPRQASRREGSGSPGRGPSCARRPATAWWPTTSASLGWASPATTTP
jgi:hypothetical protein